MFNKRPNLFNSSAIDRYQFVGQLVMAKCTVRDIVIRLTRLEEKGHGAKLFREITKNGSKITDYANVINSWTSAVKSYRDKISHLKKERNEFIAHLKDTNPSAYNVESIPIELRECIIEAIKVVDTFRNEKVIYTFKVGTMEPVINLRKHIGAE